MQTAPRPRTNRLRRTSGRLGLILASLVATVGLLELGVRLFAPHVREHALSRQLVPTDDLLGWRLAPSEVSRHKSQYFDTDYATNTLGYRDGPRSSSVSPAYRLLLFGDSQIFGWGLPVEHRFSNLVEARSDGLELWNLGVPGYGLDQQVLSYERDAAAWSADAVIFFVSQFTEQRLHYDYFSGYNKPTFHLNADGTLERRSPSGRVPRSLLYSLPGWMYTPYFVDLLLARIDHRWRSDPGVTPKSSADLLGAVLGLAAQLGEERGQAVLVLSTLRSEEEKSLQRLCARLDISYLAFGLPADQTNLVFGPYDTHWNVDANQRISESLGPQLAAVSAKEPEPASASGR